MVSVQQTVFARGQSFRVGRWLVQPELNRVSADGEEVQLEPRGMDLLVFLAGHAGEVMSRQDIVDAVWQQDFVGDTTLSSAIAVLRRALDDEVRNPRYIETIAKRGYRFVAEVVDLETVATVTPFPGLVAPRERLPYPGLTVFTEFDAEFFFGREQEADSLWEKIPRQKLLAGIGPSGVGKSSFIRAGVMPSAPEGWGTLVFEPGEAPFNSLAQALAPEFSGDTEAVQQLLACHDPDVALSLVSRWRERWSEALLVIDQFEELFTLNPDEVQVSFAQLLSRLAHSAHVHVVLVMRDDFLYDCHAHPGLAEVYKDLTVLGPLAGENLKRAMVEPALRAGYRFEDDELAGEMITEVAGERGATPMLAFALSRMWEFRDRERRLITRQAHKEIGGVTGALAQHAEEVMVAIGDTDQLLVREIFRNLVTGQGTRVAREVGELLSVFADDQHEAATKVLQELVVGRLLTAFEVPASGDEQVSSRHWVEIVHESLLTAWPRLVRWKTQDADAVQLRDQVRQAACVWHEHDRSNDLLWTGSAYRELRLWQEHYPGGLSAVEEAFVLESTQLAGRRRRRRRLAVSAGILVLAAVAIIVTGLWRHSAHQARCAEARQLLHLGQLEVDRTPGGALARAIASLELEDDPEARHLALQALWRGPKGLSVRTGTGGDEWPTVPCFSPDGRWLAAGYWSGEIALWPASGEAPTVWQAHQTPTLIWFAPGSNVLLSVGWGDPTYRFWSVPEGQLLREEPITVWKPPGDGEYMVAVGNLNRVLRLSSTSGTEGGDLRVDPQSEEVLHWLFSRDPTPAVIDPTGKLMAYGEGGKLFVTEMNSGATNRAPQLVARHDRAFQQIIFNPELTQVATVDSAGGVQLWSLTVETTDPVRTWQSNTAERCTALVFDPSGSYLVSGHADGFARIWGIDDPPDAGPLPVLIHRGGVHGLAFDPSGRWMASSSMGAVGLWPFDRARYGHVLRGHGGSVDDLTFTPDGSRLVSASSDGTVRLWPLTPTGGEHGKVLVDWGAAASFVGLSKVAVSPDGSFVVAAIGGANVVRVVSLQGEVQAEFSIPPGDVHALAVGPAGRRIAVGLMALGADNKDRMGGLHPVLIVWDRETGESTVVEDVPGAHTFQGLEFSEEGAILAAKGGLYRWDPETMDHELVLEGLMTFARCRSDDVLVGASPGARGWEATVYDLATGSSRELTTHGSIGGALNISKILAMDPPCTVVATVQGKDLRIGPITGEAPHLLLGHEDAISAVVISPDGKQIASASSDNTIRLWPVPDLTRTPLNTLPLPELLDRLRMLTLARWVRDESAPDSYAYTSAPFPGWEEVPEW